MDSAQKSAIIRNHEKLCNDIHADEVSIILQAKQILTNDTFERINSERNTKSKALSLIRHLQDTDHAWEALLDSLREAKQSHLADLLNSSLENPEELFPPTPNLQQLQENVRKYIKRNCEIIREAWHDYLPQTKLTLAYQKLRVIETNGCRTVEKDMQPEDYGYFNDESIPLFLIEGDPGIGKSTYVNKIAMDWANENEMLNKTFDIVLIVAWVNMEERNWKKSIASACGTGLNEDRLWNLLKSYKSLIILDGYDENPLKKVLEKITAKFTDDRISTTWLITTRGGHLDHFKNLNKLWLRILGFDEESALNFIKMQLNNEQTIEEILTAHASLVEIFKNPLYATMIAATELTTKLLRMEPQLRIKEIFDTFLKFQKESFFKRYPKADEEKYDRMVEKLEQYALNYLTWHDKEKLLGKLGIEMLALPRAQLGEWLMGLFEKSLNWLRKLLRIGYESTVDDQQRLKEEWLKMGLVQCVEQKLPDERNEKLNFLHQTLAEYHAAKYVAKHVKRVEFDELTLFYSSPNLFQSFVFGLRRDLFIGALKNGLPWVPFVPLGTNEMTGIFQLLEQDDSLKLYRWIIDENSIDNIITDLGKGIMFHECDINLTNVTSSLKNNVKVTELRLSSCKLTVENFDKFFQLIEEKFPKLKELELSDNSDRRFKNGIGSIEITLKYDSKTLQDVFVSCRNIDYLSEILQSKKLQNYSGAEMKIYDVQSENYDETFGNVSDNEDKRNCQRMKRSVNGVGLISYLADRLGFKILFKKLSTLEFRSCYLTVEDIIELCSLQNLTQLTIRRSKLLKKSNQNRINEQKLCLKINLIKIEESEELLEYLKKNVLIEGNLRTSKIVEPDLIAECDDATEDKFNMRFVLKHFWQSLKIGNEDVDLREYVMAYRHLNKMFPLLHRLYEFVSSDVHEKCVTLESYLADPQFGQHYESVRKMLQYENALRDKKESPSVKNLPIGAWNLLMLHRGLEYVCRVLRDVADANNQDNIGRIATHGYEETLGRFHPWLVKQAAYMASYTLPRRKELLERLGGSNDIEKSAQVLMETANIGYQVFEKVQAMYKEMNWLNLPRD